MHNAPAKLLAISLVLLGAGPAVAQFRVVSWGEFGGMRDTYTVNFLRTYEVVGQVPMTEEQRVALNKLGDKYRDGIFAATRTGDQKKVGDLLQAASDEADKLLKPDQLKRLNQIKLQAAGVYAFTREDVAKALKLTDKQKKDVAAQIAKVEKDVKDLLASTSNVPGVPSGGLDGFRKTHATYKKAFDNAVNGLNKDQKKAWNGMIGEKFELPEPPR